MNWWLYALLIVAWLVTTWLQMSMLQTLIGPTTGPLGDRRSLLPEALAIFCTTAIFLGLLIIAP